MLEFLKKKIKKEKINSDFQNNQIEYNNEKAEKNHIQASIIIPCKNEVNNLKKTIDSLKNSKNKLKFEIIVVDDNSIDRSTEFLEKTEYNDVNLIKTQGIGAARARNIGANEANGKYLFFCDAHVQVPNYCIDELVNSLEENNADAVVPSIINSSNNIIVGYGQTWNHKLEVIWHKERPENTTETFIGCGCFFGIKKYVFDEIGGFDNYFKVWGKEDEEISFKLWSFGYKIIVEPRIEIKHLFRKKHPYVVTNEDFIYNFLCLIYSHFEFKNIAKALNIVQHNPFFPPAMAKIMLNENLIKQRKKYFENRVYNDEYILKRFKIPF
ncbi:glycosyltransferase family 2 protein [Tepidibacter formicigenes]|jgi:glycosyltransferase involved in cell wall biosynthesis|uniref:Glycosyltransferase, GT2 family n=1 Tax=Tepidibacter formicigenes DSM 15518 TaxID=1123349 RepID=A0A1M6LHK7_9FIRM|nr:glycosyltransferase family 2 protein [Tepidibacter formicigenes]SHJ70638.1 Glycosyltransferase, GT2 family [Tepidibacter formicigenes DSM 15518]